MPLFTQPCMFAETSAVLFTALFSSLFVFSWLWFNGCRPTVHIPWAWNDRDCTWNTRSRIPRYVCRQEWPVSTTLACFFSILCTWLTQASTFWPPQQTQGPSCANVLLIICPSREHCNEDRGLSDACVVLVFSLRDNCIFVYEMQKGGRCPSPAQIPEWSLFWLLLSCL